MEKEEAVYRPRIGLVILLVIVGILAVLVTRVLFVTLHTFLPDEGIWYCEELNMTLDLEHHKARAIYQGAEVECGIGQEHNDRNGVIITTYGSGYVELFVFGGHCRAASGDNICIVDDGTGKKYWFKQIDQ